MAEYLVLKTVGFIRDGAAVSAGVGVVVDIPDDQAEALLAAGRIELIAEPDPEPEVVAEVQVPVVAAEPEPDPVVESDPEAVAAPKRRRSSHGQGDF